MANFFPSNYSFHLTGNIWALLLLLPGLGILWFQYRRQAISNGPQFAAEFLLILQVLALFLLVTSLLGPQFRKNKNEYYRPAILILKDQSSSFRNGRYFHLEVDFKNIQQKIIENYHSLNFDVYEADFAENVFSVKKIVDTDFSNPNSSSQNLTDENSDAESPKREIDKNIRLTEFSGIGSFLDSTPIPNLKGIFLWSDGQRIIEGEKAFAPWKEKTNPIFCPLDSLKEVQGKELQLNRVADGKSAELTLSYTGLGNNAGPFDLLLNLDGKTVFKSKLPAHSGDGTWSTIWKPNFKIPMGDQIKSVDGKQGWQGILRPENPEQNVDLLNDTLEVKFSSSQKHRRILMYKAIRSLDEKAMIDFLEQSYQDTVIFWDQENLRELGVQEKDQIWIEATSLMNNSGLKEKLQTLSSALVVYFQPNLSMEKAGKNLGGWNHFQNFTPIAEFRVNGEAAEYFPSELYRLQGLTGNNLQVPEILDSEKKPWVELIEKGKSGIMAGKVLWNGKKSVTYFVLPKIWGEIFDPGADYSIQKGLKDFFSAIKTLAGLDEKPLPVKKPVLSKALRELGHIGFDEKFLRQIAKQSGGEVIEPLNAKGEVVTSRLPQLSAEEIQNKKFTIYSLFNTKWNFISFVLLFAMIWALRKKWNLD